MAMAGAGDRVDAPIDVASEEKGASASQHTDLSDITVVRSRMLAKVRFCIAFFSYVLVIACCLTGPFL